MLKSLYLKVILTSRCIVLWVAATSKAGVAPQHMSQPGVSRLEFLKDIREDLAYYYWIFKSEVLRKMYFFNEPKLVQSKKLSIW